MELRHDPAAHRFRLHLEDGSDAFVEYAEVGRSTLDLLHTFVPRNARGRGIASALVEQVLRHAREEGLQIVPTCPFVADYLSRHPEYQPLIAHHLSSGPGEAAGS